MHHQRRRSGHASGNTSMTDVRKAPSTRPTLTRRTTTPQTSQKLGRNMRDRERQMEEERWFEEERESFPQFCMSCEKQFIPDHDQSLYCSKDCRLSDQEGFGASSSSSRSWIGSNAPTYYPFYSASSEPRDIIPRASPSRPNSTYVSPPTTPGTGQSSAINALKSSLYGSRPASPPSPPPVGNYHANVWPFSNRSSAASPNNSYSNQQSGFFSSTYEGHYYGGAGDAFNDRPLPSRRPGIYSRPKSIELVTPLVGR
ncbi:uncharacterized protein B0T23DRAFT_110481 [Neurospora hispaniola]|uniref:Life-span regulatory factor domain-containing protein n=1 Tax=Neurospora hispaniola TaxID=588809 RepID=A0AAJ0MSA7_9PEZI|nr:hypothetical protein B0T23DRAFT_110481 [Neurospora hispaniola]